MTDNYRIIIPLMTTTVLCVFISQYFSRESIYTLKLKRRGIDLLRTPEINLMDAITVGEAMDEFVEAVPPNLPLTDLIERMSRQHETGYPVIDLDGRLAGIVTMRDVEEALLSRDTKNLTAGDIATRNVLVCRPDQTLSEALTQFGARNIGRLPVIDPNRPDHVIGMLKRANIVLAYAEAYGRSSELTERADAFQALREKGRMVVEQAPVTSGSPLAGVLVRDAGFPADCVLGAISRGQQTVVPRGSTRLLPGDELFLLTTRQAAPAVRRWLARDE
jgi:CIC family chloride channel protein